MVGAGSLWLLHGTHKQIGSFRLFINDWDILLLDMVELGFGEVLSLAQTIGIVGTMVLTLYFSKRQIQSLSIHQQSRVLNDLDEKIHNTTELMLERPSLFGVVDNLGLTP